MTRNVMKKITNVLQLFAKITDIKCAYKALHFLKPSKKDWW